MKKVLFLLISAFVVLSANAQFDIKYRASDNYYLIKYGLDTTHVIPKGTTYAKLQYGNEIGLFYNNGQPIVNYVSHFLYNINGVSVVTPNALMDSLSLILGMPLDSTGGGSIAGVEHINGKDGDLKIVAGSNVTIDNSKSDTIVINASGGSGSSTASNGLQIMGDGSVGLGGNLTEPTAIERNNNDFIISNGDSSTFSLFDNSFTFYGAGVVDLGGQEVLGLSSNLIMIANSEDSLNLVLSNLKRKDTVDYLLGVNESSNPNPNIKSYTLFRTPISSGGGSSLVAGNGITISNDSIKIGGNITEDTKLDNPNSKSVQIGSDGDAMNLNVPPPSEFSGLISTYTGFDYRSAEYMSFIGVLKGLNFAPFGFVNQDMVGTFTIVGNPFDSIYPDGSVMIDGVWEQGGQVSMNKLVFTFSGSDITFNTISMSEIENTEEIEGDNAFQLKSIEGDNGNQTQQIIGNNAILQSIITGDNGIQRQLIEGEDGEITRKIDDSVNNARALEEITSTSYLFSGQKVVGSDTISASNSISPDGFVRKFKSGSLINRDTLNENMYKVEVGSIAFKLDSNGLNYGQVLSPFNLSDGVIKYEVESSGTLTLKPTHLKINPVFLGFYNKEPILQPILPLGSSTDEVIQVLQNLGLVRED